MQLLLFWVSILKRLSSLRMSRLDQKQIKRTVDSQYLGSIQIRNGMADFTIHRYRVASFSSPKIKIVLSDPAGT